MKKIEIKKIFKKIKKYPVRQTVASFPYLPKVISRWDKVILIVFSSLIIFSIGWMFLNYWLNTTSLEAKSGGEYVEGIIGENKDIDKHLPRLTNAGLTKYDRDNNIVGDLSDKWEISDDGKVYKFHLREQFTSQDLANQIMTKGIWKDVEISTPDPNTLVFTFKQSFSPFLNISTTPLFPYGPYRVVKENKKEVELVRNETYYDNIYIDKVLIKLYANKNDLLKAAKRGDIDGFGLTENQEAPKKFLKFEMNFPRDLILFFNLSNKDLQDINVRKALKENTSPGKELKFRLVTSDTPRNAELAREIVDKWGKNGVQVNLEIKDNVTLQKTTIPKRDYDLLLYGLDYGEDPDPYPFWHSSQIKEDGRNLSNFRNVNADKLLEQARLEFDLTKRKDKYYEFQKILDSEIPMFVVEHQNYYYFTRENVYGIEYIVGTNESDRFLDIANWYMETKRIKK